MDTVAISNPEENEILNIKNLKTHFFLDSGTVKAVDGVDLQLSRRSVLGLVGESGCGKSVMARSIMRLIKSPPGKIIDSTINDAINQYLVFTEMRASNKKSIFELPQKVEELKKENRILKSTIDTLSTRKRACRTQKKKHESSPLQMYLALERPLGIRIKFIETGTTN